MDKYDDIQSQLKAWAGFVSSGYEVPAAGGTMNAAADAIKELVSEVERLKGVLALIAVVDQGCGGNLTPMEQASSAMRQARSALEAKP